MTDIERFRDAMRYLDGLANLSPVYDYMRDRKTPEVYLKRTRHFFARLGNPHAGFKFVHITGTSGKGTVATMVHEALAYSRKRVGSFTSPYATAATEKIRVGGSYIPPREFADILDNLKPHIEAEYLSSPYGRPAYFEIFLAIALIYFKRQKCEWVVLEVGAGGRYDATNVIEKPHVTAVTSIDYDHMHILGRTLLSIADNKAGIAKRGAHFFTTEKRPALLELFKKECKKVGAHYNAITPVADYQENNRKLASAISFAIGLKESAIQKGITAARLPCRFETVQTSPRIVLDGAHNRAKMRSTAENVKNMKHMKLHLVIGMNAKKETDAILQEIVPLASHVYVTRFQSIGMPSAEPIALAKNVRALLKKSMTMSVHLDPFDALDAAVKAADKKDLILATGSFYLAGDLRRKWYPEEWVLTHGKSFR